MKHLVLNASVYLCLGAYVCACLRGESTLTV